MKLVGQVGCMTRTNWFDFGGRSGSGSDNVFYVILHHWEIVLNRYISTISQKVVDGFGRNLVGRLGVWQGRIDSILVKIRIWIRELYNFKSDSSPLRDRAKNDIVLYCMIFQKCIGPDMFSWIRHYVAEVCALPSALLVENVIVGLWQNLMDKLGRWREQAN